MSDYELRFHITNDQTYMENGYTVYLRDGGPCWIIDPGLPPQATQIVALVRAHSLTPSAVVLTHVRTLLDLRSRYLAEQNAAADTLNRVALLPTLETSELRFRLKGDHIAILSREGDETLLEVRNIGTAGQPETPIDQAYTPFQSYRAAPESRYSVSLIKQSLPPPDL